MVFKTKMTLSIHSIFQMMSLKLFREYKKEQFRYLNLVQQDIKSKSNFREWSKRNFSTFQAKSTIDSANSKIDINIKLHKKNWEDKMSKTLKEFNSGIHKQTNNTVYMQTKWLASSILSIRNQVSTKNAQWLKLFQKEVFV